jgi:hypothetical protein
MKGAGALRAERLDLRLGTLPLRHTPLSTAGSPLPLGEGLRVRACLPALCILTQPGGRCYAVEGEG